jgi:hypothetical protein
MFAPTYFAPTYFPPSYFAVGGTIAPTVATDFLAAVVAHWDAASTVSGGELRVNKKRERTAPPYTILNQVSSRLLLHTSTSEIRTVVIAFRTHGVDLDAVEVNIQAVQDAFDRIPLAFTNGFAGPPVLRDRTFTDEPRPGVGTNTVHIGEINLEYRVIRNRSL